MILKEEWGRTEKRKRKGRRREEERRKEGARGDGPGGGTLAMQARELGPMLECWVWSEWSRLGRQGDINHYGNWLWTLALPGIRDPSSKNSKDRIKEVIAIVPAVHMCP